MEIDDNLKCCGNCDNREYMSRGIYRIYRCGLNKKQVWPSSGCRSGWAFDDMDSFEREEEASELNNC